MAFKLVSTKPEKKYSFTSRADAYAYMYMTLIEKGIDAEQAATRSNDFAKIMSENLNLPSAVEPEKNFIQKVFYYLKETQILVKENPEAIELIRPAGAALLGVVGGIFGGATVAAVSKEEPKKDPIDFDNLTEIKQEQNANIQA